MCFGNWRNAFLQELRDAHSCSYAEMHYADVAELYIVLRYLYSGPLDYDAVYLCQWTQVFRANLSKSFSL